MHLYLLATLPGFELEDPPPVDIEALLASCRSLLTGEEALALEDPTAAEGDSAAARVARTWVDLERQIRNAVARRRAATWGVAPEAYLRPHQAFRADIETGVAQAFEAKDPMARQKALDGLRWRVLVDLANEDPFGFAAVFAYVRRLHLAAAWAERKPRAGRAVMEQALEALEKQEETGAMVVREVEDA